jgi:hypothetical protein
MADDKVGYGQPPKAFQFKRGASGNPKGRPKRKPVALAEIIENALTARIRYRERGQTKTGSRTELGLRMMIDRAVKGDLGAAELVLVIRAHAQRTGDAGVERLEVSDWLPDRPGQTAEEKTRDFVDKTPANAAEWWQSNGVTESE